MYLIMHKWSSLEVDKVQQQNTSSGSTSVIQVQKAEVIPSISIVFQIKVSLSAYLRTILCIHYFHTDTALIHLNSSKVSECVCVGPVVVEAP